MIFQTEKQLKDLGDKLPADKKAPIEGALNKLKEAHKAQDIAGIDAAMEKLNSVFQADSQEMYNAQGGGAQGGPQADPTSVVNKLAVMQVAATTAKTVTLRTLTLRK